MALLEFITNNWLFTIVILVIILLVVKIIKDLIKALILSVIVVVLFLSYAYYDTGGETKPVEVSAERRAEMMGSLDLKIMKTPLNGIMYEEAPNGRYTISANNMTVKGTWDSIDEKYNFANITEGGQTIEIDVNDSMRNRFLQIKATNEKKE